jgi:hypothetical protein
MKAIQVAVDAGLAASLAMALQAEQGGGRAGGAATAGTSGALIGGTVAPAKPDPPGGDWQVNASILSCRGVGAAPMIGMRDALESSIQKPPDHVVTRGSRHIALLTSR